MGEPQVQYESSLEDMLTTSRFLFVIGVEKCGTTSLYRAMQSLPEFNLTKKKESSFFRTQYEKGISYFESLFSDSFEGEAFNTDITPLYHRFPKVLRRIERFDAKKKILIMLRNPVSRAFSHYVHDIINHVVTGERTANFKQAAAFSFVDLWEKKSAYFLRYQPIVAGAFERFGKQNCHVVFFEQMVRDWKREATALDDFFGFPDPVLASVELPHENRVESIPYFFTYGTPPGEPCWLAQKTARGVTLFEDLDNAQVSNALATQGSYTLDVSESLVAEMIGWAEPDISGLESLLDVDLSGWRQPFEMKQAFATVEQEDLVFVRESVGPVLQGASYAGFGLRRFEPSGQRAEAER